MQCWENFRCQPCFLLGVDLNLSAMGLDFQGSDECWGSFRVVELLTLGRGIRIGGEWGNSEELRYLFFMVTLDVWNGLPISKSG